MIPFLILIIVSSVTSDVCSELNTSSVPTLEKVHDLWNWCLDDTNCVDLFYQDHPNFTVFNFLTKNIASQYNSLDSAYNDLFCNKTLEESLRNLWLLILRAKINETQLCDINHVVVVDTNQLTRTCVCRGDKICKDISDHMNGIYVILSLFLFISVCIVIFLIVQIILQVRKGKTENTTETKKVKVSSLFDKREKKKPFF